MARFRSEAGITQEKLAEAAGLDVGYISLIERGHRMPTVDTIFRLCRGLNVSPSELIREVEKQERKAGGISRMTTQTGKM